MKFIVRKKTCLGLGKYNAFSHKKTLKYSTWKIVATADSLPEAIKLIPTTGRDKWAVFHDGKIFYEL